MCVCVCDSQCECIQINITEDNLDEVNEAVVLIVRESQQTEANLNIVQDVIFTTAEFVRNDSSLVDEEVQLFLQTEIVDITFFTSIPSHRLLVM